MRSIVDPTNRFAFVPDLGLDKVLAYRFDAAKGTLTPNDPSALATSPGAGPRHIAFHPNGKWAYVINELDSTVIALRVRCSKAGVLTLIDTVSTLPGRRHGRKHHRRNCRPPQREIPVRARIAGTTRSRLFAIDQTTGRLSSLGHYLAGGRTPRNFNIDPSGKFLLSANLDSDSVTVHQIDVATGRLSRTAHEIKVLQPYCIEFLP